MKGFLDKMKSGTIWEKPVKVKGTVLRSTVIAPGGAGCSQLVFVLKEHPKIAFAIKNWSVGNHEILFTAPNDKVSFLFRKGLQDIPLDSFQNLTYRNLVKEISQPSRGKARAPHESCLN